MSAKFPVRATVTALFSAAPERVFDAFLDTRMVGRFMFGPGVRDEAIVSLTNDPRTGGTFSYIVRRQEKAFDHFGEYIEIERPRRLVFSWTVRQDPAGSESRIVIEIAPIIDGCEVTLTHEMPSGQENFIEQARIAWGKMLDKLTEVLDDV
ncbi:SRPBCC family protein [Flavitalea sp. BT771]|uniref:SRPBCC family protein n=1 Tax=Flavitalea sp. BT771 TaxID=3063329 RepID=UPI0026E20B81|nr:SRPBCC family protein [Flavitalea sp. BT771]MDO6434543.1 SRPBCC family protein [Flavitalea sp. BT771]MDV6223443.1 SRPBCC family protein [Flavitalea sp. BT771]